MASVKAVNPPLEENLQNIIEKNIDKIVEACKNAKTKALAWKSDNEGKMNNMSIQDAMAEITKTSVLSIDQFHKATEILLKGIKENRGIGDLGSSESPTVKKLKEPVEAMELEETGVSEDFPSSPAEHGKMGSHAEVSRRDSSQSKKSSESGPKSVFETVPEAAVKCAYERIIKDYIEERDILKIEIPAIIEVNVNSTSVSHLVKEAEKYILLKRIVELYEGKYKKKELLKATDLEAFVKSIEEKALKKRKKEMAQQVKDQKQLPDGVPRLLKLILEDLLEQEKSAAAKRVNKLLSLVQEPSQDVKQSDIPEFPDRFFTLYDMKVLLERYQRPIMEMYRADIESVKQMLSNVTTYNLFEIVGVKAELTKEEAYRDFQARETVVLHSLFDFSVTLKKRNEFRNEYLRLAHNMQMQCQDANLEELQKEFIRVLTNPEIPDYLKVYDEDVGVERKVKFVRLEHLPSSDSLRSIDELAEDAQAAPAEKKDAAEEIPLYFD